MWEGQETQRSVGENEVDRTPSQGLMSFVRLGWVPLGRYLEMGR